MKSELVRLARHTLVYGAGQVITRVISMLLLPLFTAYLTPADYGISSMLGLIAFVITPLFGLGFGAVIGVIYYRSSDPEHRARVIWTGFAALVISSGLLVILAVLFGREISTVVLGVPHHAHMVAIALAGAACSIAVTPLMLFFQFENRSTAYVTITALSTGAGLLASVVLIVGMRRGVQGLVEGSALTQCLTLLLFLVPCARALRPRLQWRVAGELLKLGAAFIPSFAWLFIIQHGNKYMLERSHGVDALGIYTIGFNLGMVMTIAVSGFQSAWMPYFMSFLERRKEGEGVFGRTLTYYVLGFGTLSLLFFAGARAAILILTQPAFHGAYVAVGPSAAAQFFTGVFSVLLPAIYFANRVQFVSVIQAVAAVVAAAVNFVLIRWFGIVGAAVGVAAGSLLLPLCQQAWNARHAGYIRPAYDWRRVGGYALFYGAFAALFMASRRLSLPLELAFAVCGGLVAVAAAIAFLRREEREALARSIRAAGEVVRKLVRPEAVIA